VKRIENEAKTRLTDGDGIVSKPRGTTQVVIRGQLMIECQIAGVSVRGTRWRLDQSEHDTWHWRVSVRGTVAVSPSVDKTFPMIMRNIAEFDESDTYVLERFDTSAGNLVKGFFLIEKIPDHRSIFKDGCEGT
ncbi:hypothetical protein Tco_1040030, partial [Tanacetum coccineum]